MFPNEPDEASFNLSRCPFCIRGWALDDSGCCWCEGTGDPVIFPGWELVALIEDFMTEFSHEMAWRFVKQT